MSISQEALGRFTVLRRYRWALAGSIFWSISTLTYITLIVLAVANGKSPGFQQIFWLVLSVGFVIQGGISLVWHRRSELRVGSKWTDRPTGCGSSCGG